MSVNTQTINRGTVTGIALFHLNGPNAVGPLCGERFAQHVLRITCAGGVTADVAVPVDETYVTIYSAIGTSTLCFRPEETGNGSASLWTFGRWRDIKVTFTAANAGNAISWESRPAGGAV